MRVFDKSAILIIQEQLVKMVADACLFFFFVVVVFLKGASKFHFNHTLVSWTFPNVSVQQTGLKARCKKNG